MKRSRSAAPAPPREPLAAAPGGSILDRILQQLAADQGTNGSVREWARRLLQGEVAEGGGREGGPPGK
jgi:hypothetical protein